MKRKPLTVDLTYYKCEHKRAYPDSPKKRIYARKVTETIVMEPRNKVLSALAKILQE